MKWRKIRILILTIQAFIYRAFIVFCNFLFFYLLFDNEGKAFKLSITWNVINFGLYYIFHFVWAKAFKLGKD